MQLIREGKIQVDRLKCADWPNMIADAQSLAPVYVHFPFDVGTPSGRKPDPPRALEMMRGTHTPYANYHIVSYDRDYPELARDARAEQVVTAFTELLLADTHAAVAAFGQEKVIVENIPWFGPTGEFHIFSVDPAIISRVIRETRVGFLLDLSHARIAAHYLGLDPKQYVESLPLNHLKELHITGVRMHNTRLADHLDLQEEDWHFFDWAMTRIEKRDWPKPWTVAFEYGGIGAPFKWRSDINVIREQVPRLYDRVHNA
ncbi:MAG TPA: DUF692 family protein [Tepidisphaeraceae bacterium]